MEEYMKSNLWRQCFVENGNDLYQDKRDRLRVEYANFREKAKLLAGETARDLPEFTVHDISHSDALWEYAGLIAGTECELNPAEAFILGGAFLIHDLAMGLAAYPGGIKALKEENIWRDIVASLYMEKYGAVPEFTVDSRQLDRNIEVEAVKKALRWLHAPKCTDLAIKSFDKKGESIGYFLINDDEIRAALGPLIGKVAASHGFPIDNLLSSFGKIQGAPATLPPEWDIDSLKIACLFRAADACHLDERRAPRLLQSVREIPERANSHWIFQEKLNRPRLENDRLVFSSRSFSEKEAESWWLCFDMIRMADHELRQIDSMLSDQNKKRFAAKSVAFTSTPEQFAKMVPTENWQPVDVRIRVNSVAALVKNLGGEQLYGPLLYVPLRELVQNSTDAINARRILENKSPEWGEIIVRQGNDGTGFWLEVEDNGIGMSEKVLTGPLLDFGGKFWYSEMMLNELPALAEKGFYPIGRFGIGFFSLFMWGAKVRITTLRCGKAREDTLILELNEGAQSRPLLRKAKEKEQRLEGGTSIRAWIDNEIMVKSLKEDTFYKNLSLEECCKKMFPGLDASLKIETVKRPLIKIIAANDWLTIDGTALLERINSIKGDDNHRFPTHTDFEILGGNLRIITDRLGKPVARICISPFPRRHGIITTGGIRTNTLHSNIAGVLTGEPVTASREYARPFPKPHELSRWATEQSSLLLRLSADVDQLSMCAALIKRFGGQTGDLPIAYSKKHQLITANNIRKLDSVPDEVILIRSRSLEKLKELNKSLELKDNVIIVYSVWPSYVYIGLFDRESKWPKNEYVDYEDEKIILKQPPVLEQAVVEGLAARWACTADEIQAESIFSTPESPIIREIGRSGNNICSLEVDIIRKPVMN